PYTTLFRSDTDARAERGHEALAQLRVDHALASRQARVRAAQRRVAHGFAFAGRAVALALRAVAHGRLLALAFARRAFGLRLRLGGARHRTRGSGCTNRAGRAGGAEHRTR